jgi:nitrate reductase gamma subunit
MHHFLYGIYPYIALSVMIIASAARYDRDPFTWKSKSSQLLRRRSFIIGSVLFHVGVLLIFAGHLIGLLTPIWIFDALGVPHGAKQIIGGFILLVRRLYDPRIAANSTFADTGILILLVAQLVLGVGSIFVSAQHLDGLEMVKFMSWAQGIFTFDPKAASYIADVNWIFKAHIALGLTIFLLFPFTRLVHIVSAPVRFLWRPGYQIVRTRRHPAE